MKLSIQCMCFSPKKSLVSIKCNIFTLRSTFRIQTSLCSKKKSLDSRLCLLHKLHTFTERYTYSTSSQDLCYYCGNGCKHWWWRVAEETVAHTRNTMKRSIYHSQYEAESLIQRNAPKNLNIHKWSYTLARTHRHDTVSHMFMPFGVSWFAGIAVRCLMSTSVYRQVWDWM